MKKNKKFWAICLTICCICAISAISISGFAVSKYSLDGLNWGKTKAELSKNPDNKKAVAIVNGDIITREEFLAYKQGYKSTQKQLSNTELLDNLIK